MWKILHKSAGDTIEKDFISKYCENILDIHTMY